MKRKEKIRHKFTLRNVSLGGKARAKALSPRRRSEIARMGARAKHAQWLAIHGA